MKERVVTTLELEPVDAAVLKAVLTGFPGYTSTKDIYEMVQAEHHVSEYRITNILVDFVNHRMLEPDAKFECWRIPNKGRALLNQYEVDQ
jgi:hypothetical protein